jgi:hypothetical protein
MNLFKLYDYNTRNEAITRLHGSGSIVPKKVTGKYIYNLEKINYVNSIPKGKNILLIHEYNSPNDALNLQKQLLQIQNDINYTISLEYTQSLNMSLYDSKNNPTGNIFTKAIKQKIDTLENDGYYYTSYVPYDGSDLTPKNYGVVIICTKRLPFYDGLTNQNIDITEYNPNFGNNLQNYINSGGNVIMANNIWQNDAIPNFKYSAIPFVYKQPPYYQYGLVDINTINFLVKHPILKKCSNAIAFNPPVGLSNIIVNMIVNPDAQLVATTKNNIPFIGVYIAPSGSRTVAINAYIFNVSSKGVNNVELAKIIYNSIYWCLKINV